MKILFLIIFGVFNLQSYSQKWSLSPFIGNAVMVSGTDKGLQLPNSNDLYGLGFNYLKMNYHLMSPLTFGLKVNYKKDRLTYSTGLIFGDQSWSNVQFYTLGPKIDNQIYTNTLVLRGSGTGLYNFKIPISVDYNLSPPIKRSTGVELSLHTGINFMLYEKWDPSKFDDLKPLTADGNNGWMMLPYYYSSINMNNDVIDQVYWSANLNKGINLSFDLGLNFNWYIKSRHWVTSSLYYEQGVRNVSAIVGEIYVNGEYVGLDGVYSRGSAIHLKLLFPITLKKKTK